MSEKETGGSSLDIFDQLMAEAPKEETPDSALVPPPPPTGLALPVETSADVPPAPPPPPSVATPSSQLPGSTIDTVVAHLPDPKKTMLGMPASGPPPSGSVPRVPSAPPSQRPSVPAMPAQSVRPSQQMPAVPVPPPSVRPPLPSVRAVANVPNEAPLAVTPAAPSTSRALTLDPQVDMEWDDEEATHVFDNKQHRGPLSAPPPATKSSPPALPASASTPPKSVKPATLPSSAVSVAPAAASTPPGATNPSVKPAPPSSTPQMPISVRPAAIAAAPARSSELPPTQAPRSETLPPARAVEPSGSPTRGLIVGLVAATLVGGALLYTMTPKRGTLRIDVTGADGHSLDRIDGMVDGKHECDTSPCLVKNLDLGDHVVKVFANGYDKPEEQSVKTSGDETKVSIVLRSPIRKASVHVSAAPPGTKVALIGGDERHELSSIPGDVKELDPKVAWTVVGTLAGAPEFRMPLSLAPGESRDLSVVFPVAPAAVVLPSSAPATQAAAPAPTAPAAAASAPKTAAAAAPESTEPATLNLNSIPASSVVLDGKPLGPTPKLGVTVTAGKHTVLFINTDQDLRKKVDVVVKGGETKTVATKLTP